MKLGRVTQASPLEVALKGETDAMAQPAERYAGMVPVVGQQVLVASVESRRLIVWASP